MKKVIEIAMFDKNNTKIMTKVLDTKTVKGLAQIKRIGELEYDGDAHVRLCDAIVEVINKVASNVEYNIDYFIIYNDYYECAEVFKAGEIWPMETIGQCPRHVK